MDDLIKELEKMKQNMQLLRLEVHELQAEKKAHLA